jgi:hypothetical protein
VVGLGEDQLCLAASQFLRVGCGLLGRDERVGEKHLALLEVGELLLGVLELVGELPALAPDLLEAVCHVFEHAVRLVAPIAEKPSADPHMPQFDRCVPHLLSSPSASGAAG